jgi:SAM-dependent methyltransferase
LRTLTFNPVAGVNQTGARPDGDVELETLRQCRICGSNTIISIDPANRICKCDHCGYVFVNPRPTQAEIIAFYSRSTQYDHWLAEESERWALWLRRLKIVRRYKRSGRLLDVGTGTGQFLTVARRFFEVHGTEVSDSGVRIARDKYGLNVSQGELGSIGFSCRFDVVTLFHVLEHVPSPLSTIEACRRLLGDDGVLLIAVPNDIHRLRSVVRRGLAGLGLRRFGCPMFHGVSRMRLDGTQHELHLSHFTPSVLRNLLVRGGFRVTAATLDPYYVTNELEARAKARRHFHGHLLLHGAFGVNLYETMLVVARPARRRGPPGAGSPWRAPL